MSIHVISAVLNCRDPELTSSRRMVLVSLANYAGEDGHAWPSQKLVSEESGCGIRSLKDHLKWLEQNGFIRRDTKNLGQGKGSRTSYHVDLKRLARISADAGAQIAGANNARAKSVSLGGGIPHLTNRQEPSIPIEDKSSIGDKAQNSTESKIRSGRVRGSARKTSLPDNWAPTITAYATASKLGMTREEINHEADQFRNSAIANGRTYADWDAAFRTWIGNNVKWRAERAAKRSVSTSPGGKSSRSSILTAGMRAVAELRGYGEPVSGLGGMGTGDVIEGELFGSDGFGQSGQDHRRLGRTGAD